MATITEKLQDPNLSEKEQDEIIGAFIQHQEDQRLRSRWEQKLQREYKLVKKDPVKIKRSATIRKIGVLFAAIAACLLLLFAVLPHFLQPDGRKLLANYVEDIELAGVRDVEQTPSGNLRRQFAEAFSANNFREAASIGEVLIALPAATDEDKLQLGEAYLKGQQFSQANDLFNELIAGNSVFSTEARFNLALSLLSQAKIQEGLAALQKIASTDGNRIYQEAQELLEADWD